MTFSRFNFTFLLAVAALSLPFVFLGYVIHQAGETTSYSKIVERQIQSGGIYGSSMNAGTYYYKLKLLSTMPASVIALGSSRTMQFRKEMFAVPMINMAGAANDLLETRAFLREIKKLNPDAHVILGLDFWWFNDRTLQNPRMHPLEESPETLLTAEKLFSSIKYLLERRFSLGDYIRILRGNSKNSYFSWENIGFQAIKNSYGYRVDGSYFYSKLYFNLDNYVSPDEKFEATFQRIRGDTARFERADRISEAGLNEMRELFHEFFADGRGRLDVFMPPISSSVLELMKNQPQSFPHLFELASTLKKEGIHVMDFTDPKIINSEDCEFIDGFHGGDVTYLRILHQMDLEAAKIKGPTQPLSIPPKDYLALIEKWAGHSLIPFGPNETRYPEVDFLKLGCKKESTK